jgi:hypothetical protein
MRTYRVKVFVNWVDIGELTVEAVSLGAAESMAIDEIACQLEAQAELAEDQEE